MPIDLPTDIDATYPDNPGDTSVEIHQQYHDEIHGRLNLGAGLTDKPVKWNDTTKRFEDATADLSATYDAGAVTNIYVDPAGSDANSGLIRSQPKQTIAAAITALGSGLGQVNLKKNATFTISSGLTWDVAKVRVVGKRTVIDASSMTTGTAVALTSSVANTTGSYDHRANRPPLQGVKIKGSGRTNTVVGLSLAGGTTNELAHVRAAWDVTVTGFGTGLSLGSGVHNIEMGVDIYECGRCIDDTAATTNAGERIVFVGGAFFNSNMAAYLHNSTGDYTFLACSFDYNVQQFDIAGSQVHVINPHIESNDANYGTNVPLTIASGAFVMHGGVITGSVTTIPHWITNSGGDVVWRDVTINSNTTTGTFHNTTAGHTSITLAGGGHGSITDTQVAEDASFQTTTSLTYVTPGSPISVNVSVGPSQAVRVSHRSALYNSAGAGNYCYSAIEVSGASTIAADDNKALITSGADCAFGQDYVLTGLNQGVNTFSVKFRADVGGTARIGRVHLAVTPL